MVSRVGLEKLGIFWMGQHVLCIWLTIKNVYWSDWAWFNLYPGLTGGLSNQTCRFLHLPLVNGTINGTINGHFMPSTSVYLKQTHINQNYSYEIHQYVYQPYIVLVVINIHQPEIWSIQWMVAKSCTSWERWLIGFRNHSYDAPPWGLIYHLIATHIPPTWWLYHI